jgi:hypothetical protein
MWNGRPARYQSTQPVGETGQYGAGSAGASPAWPRSPPSRADSAVAEGRLGALHSRDFSRRERHLTRKCSKAPVAPAPRRHGREARLRGLIPQSPKGDLVLFIAVTSVAGEGTNPQMQYGAGSAGPSPAGPRSPPSRADSAVAEGRLRALHSRDFSRRGRHLTRKCSKAPVAPAPRRHGREARLRGLIPQSPKGDLVLFIAVTSVAGKGT